VCRRKVEGRVTEPGGRAGPQGAQIGAQPRTVQAHGLTVAGRLFVVGLDQDGSVPLRQGVRPR
jgi:hypothetical protein